MRQLAEKTPLKRVGVLDDVARTVRFLVERLHDRCDGRLQRWPHHALTVPPDPWNLSRIRTRSSPASPVHYQRNAVETIRTAVQGTMQTSA